jgi:P4 family phage/plasmid primase-like protien
MDTPVAIPSPIPISQAETLAVPQTHPFLDFNTAAPQEDGEERGYSGYNGQKADRQFSKEDIIRGLLNRLPEILRVWYPNGRRDGNTYLIGNIQGDAGQSLKISLEGEKKGCWYDFANSGDYGDILDLWAVRHGWNTRNKSDFPKILRSAQEWLGMTPCSLPKVPGQTQNETQNQKQTQSQTQNKDWGVLVKSWFYRDHDGIPTVRVCRYDKDGKKSFRPFDLKAKKYGCPSPRPLYNLPGIALSNAVVVVEGEKCAEALIALGICATTAMNGANTPVDKTDWSPLVGKHVLVWPDHDVPGKELADRVIHKLRSLGLLSLSLMAIPDDKPETWDVADAIEAGVDIRAFMESFSHKVPPLPECEGSTDFVGQPENVPEGGALAGGLITIGSDFEIGRRSLQDLRQKHGNVIFTEGDFYRYQETQWVALTPKELHDEIEKYDGYPYSNPDKNETKLIKLNASKKNSAIHTMEHGASSQDFFKETPLGINCANGFIKFIFNKNLNKWSAVLEEHKPEHRQRHTLRGNWVEDAPTWVQGSLHSRLLNGSFCGDADKDDKIQSMKELAGATISGCATRLLQPRAVILLGTQAENGKSQVLNMLRSLLPPSAISSVTAARMGDERHILGICGKLLNASDELSGASAISSEVFKAVITGETVSGRDVYKSRIEFRPIAQHVFATNALPSFQGGMDRGVQRRLLVIPFNRVIPKEEKIENIGCRVAEEEMDLLLAWAVEGALDLMNNRGFTITDALAGNLQDWLEESDSVQGWVAECVEIVDDKDAYLKTPYAYQCYQAWAKEQGIKPEQIVGLKNFVRRMAAISGVHYKRTKAGRIFAGITLTHDAPRSTSFPA